MADKIRARWPLYAVLLVVLLVVVGLGYVMADAPEKQVASLSADTSLTGDEIAVLEAAREDAQRVVDRIDEVLARRPRRTTTTVAGTTTTQVPTTTTTASTTTLPVQSGDYWDFMVTATIGTQRQGWTATYFRNLTYTAGVGWTDGDRTAYRCGYGFLMRDGVPVGRVTFTRIPEAASYSALNDRYMVEGSRYYDGTRNTNGNLSQLNDCPLPSEAYDAQTAIERPTIRFTGADGQLLEVRDYKKAIPGPNITWQSVLVTSDRVTVIAYLDGLPFMALYYDSMPGSGVVLSSDT